MQKRCLLLTVAVLLPGCGLTDYEEQLKATQERLKLVDEENQLLADPLELPDRGTPVFFRPPKGITSKPSKTGDWLVHFPWSDSSALVPPLEVLVGVLSKKTEGDIDAKVKEALRAHADANPEPRSPPHRTEFFIRQGESRHLPRDQPSEAGDRIKYERAGWTTREKPLWPAPDRAKAPEVCVYDYDVYTRSVGDWLVIVIFKRLNRAETAKLWKEKGVDQALIDRLPSWEPKKAGDQNQLRASLATLRVGAAAKARLEPYGKP